ncbi:MAG: phosphatase PAP2 family protein [Thermoproteus sp.]|nr:phosphatase PAP2 family protein [Thermoproteus sp.]
MRLSRALALYLAFAAVTSMALAYGETSPWNLSAFSAIYGAKSAAASAVLVPLSVDDYGRAFFWIPILVALWLTGGRYREAADLMAASFAVSLALGIALKHLFFLPRPFAALGVTPLVPERASESSYPSGHALIVAAGALSAASLPWYIALPLWAEALLVSYGRIYVGVHWPLDVVAGWLLAAANVELVKALPQPRRAADRALAVLLSPIEAALRRRPG